MNTLSNVAMGFKLLFDRLTHKNVSFVKSVLRIGAGGALMGGSLITAGLLFIIAEVLGIVEENVQ